MEFWFMQDFEDKMLLPVNPGTYTTNYDKSNEVVNINDLGEYSILGKPKLHTIEFESFFPSKDYHFVKHTSQSYNSPYDYIKKLNVWKDSKSPIRFLITTTSINMFCTIESFSYYEESGSRDVYFSVSLREYRQIPVVAEPNIAPPKVVTPSVTQKSLGEYGWTSTSASLRESPNGSAKVLKTIPKGTKVYLTTMQGDWYRLTHSNTAGWVHGTQLVWEDEKKSVATTTSSGGGGSYKAPSISNKSSASRVTTVKKATVKKPTTKTIGGYITKVNGGSCYTLAKSVCPGASADEISKYAGMIFSQNAGHKRTVHPPMGKAFTVPCTLFTTQTRFPTSRGKLEIVLPRYTYSV